MNSESPADKPDEPEKCSGSGANQILTGQDSIIGGAMQRLPPLHDLDDLELQRISQLCLPSWDSRKRWRDISHAVRPERPEYSFLLRIPQSEAWNQALRQIQAGYFEGRRFEHTLTTVTPSIHKPIFGAISMILYDNQLRQTRPITNALDGKPFCAVKSKQEADEYLCVVHYRLKFIDGTLISFYDLGKIVLEHMLYVDYCIGTSSLRPSFPWSYYWPFWLVLCSAVSDYSACCAYTTPPKALTELLAHHLQFLHQLAASLSCWTSATYEYDLALMLHHYWTHLKATSVCHFWHGATGYTGIMTELVAEVPIVGTERLGRKLSVDYHENIKKFVRCESDRKIMMKKVENIAAEFGVVLGIKNTRGLGTPMLEIYCKDGLSRQM